MHLSVATERDGVAALPAGTARATLDLSVAMAFLHTTVHLASAGKPTELTMLVDRVADPVDARIATNSLVDRIDEDDFEVLVGTVLSNPVRVENTETTAFAANAFLGLRAKAALELELVDTHVGGLAHGGSLGHRSLAATTFDADAVDNVTLLGL